MLIYLIKSIYLFFSPAPWTEYSLEGVLDSYQLAAGVWSGQAWGILPVPTMMKAMEGRMWLGLGRRRRLV